MLDHIDFAVVDLAKSRAFYTAALAPLGLHPILEIDDEGRKGTGFGREEVGILFIGGGPPVVGRLHLAIRAPSREAVDRFFDAAIAAGGTEHGAPGPRPRYGARYYAAYVRDPDDHVVEAVFRGGAAR